MGKEAKAATGTVVSPEILDRWTERAFEVIKDASSAIRIPFLVANCTGFDEVSLEKWRATSASGPPVDRWQASFQKQTGGRSCSAEVWMEMLCARCVLRQVVPVTSESERRAGRD